MHYNLTTRDLFEMSWRRFAILFGGIFSWTTPDDGVEGSLPPEYSKAGIRRSHWEQAVHEARGATGEIQRSIDWDGLQGRAKPDSHAIITTAELLSGMEK